jgi:hypothetical protein
LFLQKEFQMALITNNELQAILDKLARYGSEAVGDPEFSNAFNAGMAKAAADTLVGGGGLATYILAINDVDVEADLLPAARNLAENVPVPPDGFLLGIPEITAMITALSTHIKRYAGGPTTLDLYLTSLNVPTPTLRAHGHFAKYLKALTARNVFIPADLDIASFAVTAATTGTFTHDAAISITQYGGAKLVAHNVGALNSTTGISVTAKKFDGTTQVLTASIATLTDTHETDLSVTSQLFYDVTAIAVTGATNGDHIKIVAKTDRSIVAA